MFYLHLLPSLSLLGSAQTSSITSKCSINRVSLPLPDTRPVWIAPVPCVFSLVATLLSRRHPGDVGLSLLQHVHTRLIYPLGVYLDDRVFIVAAW